MVTLLKAVTVFLIFPRNRSGHLDAIVVADVVANGYIEANPDLASFELPEEHKLGLSMAFQKGQCIDC